MRPAGRWNVVDKVVVGGRQGVRVGVISLGVVILNVPKEAVLALLIAVGKEKAGHELLFDLGGGHGDWLTSISMASSTPSSKHRLLDNPLMYPLMALHTP